MNASTALDQVYSAGTPNDRSTAMGVEVEAAVVAAVAAAVAGEPVAEAVEEVHAYRRDPQKWCVAVGGPVVWVPSPIGDRRGR